MFIEIFLLKANSNNGNEEETEKPTGMYYNPAKRMMFAVRCLPCVVEPYSADGCIRTTKGNR